MPDINPKGVGDNFYPRYNVVTTEPCSASLAVKKGRLYTEDASGHLVAPTTALEIFKHGIYQATRDFTAGSTAGSDSVQCFGPGSRVCLKATAAGVERGAKVRLNGITGDNLSQVKVWDQDGASLAKIDLHTLIGRVYKIYSKTDITVEKDLTAAGDLVIVVLE